MSSRPPQAPTLKQQTSRAAPPPAGSLSANRTATHIPPSPSPSPSQSQVHVHSHQPHQHHHQHHHQQQHQAKQQQQQQGPPGQWVLGVWVRLVTMHGVQVEGQIYAYDASTSCIVIQSPHTLVNSPVIVPNKFDFSIIKVAFIKTVETLASTHPGTSTLASQSYESLASNHVATPSTLVALGKVQLARLRSKETAAVKAEKRRAELVRSGVAPEGLQLFDALAKTMGCVWRGGDIVVMQEVVVRAPFRPKDCAVVDGRKRDANTERALVRVRKVLDGERRRLNLVPRE